MKIMLDLFTQNFMRSLINQLASSQRMLHAAAKKTTKEILGRSMADSRSTMLILKALLIGPYGNINFDQVTRSKTIEILLSQIQAYHLMELVAIYEELILRPGVKDEKSASSRRLAVADQLFAVIRNLYSKHIKVDEATTERVFIEKVLSVLVGNAYLDNGTPSNPHHPVPDPPISQTSRKAFRSRVTSSLAQLLGKPGDYAYYPYFVAKTIYESGASNAQQSSHIQFDNATSNIIRKAWKVIEVANSDETLCAAGCNYSKSVVLLYSLTLLQIYNEDAEAISILEELNQIFENQILGKGLLKGTTALVEILLSFISRPSRLFRGLAQQVFTSCASSIDSTGLKSMTRVCTKLI